ncbi:unnamed protein product [Brassica oleracea var. botrytis]
MLEQMFNEDPDNIPEDWQLDDEENTEHDTSEPLETVPVRRFDHDFWEPLIGESLAVPMQLRSWQGYMSLKLPKKPIGQLPAAYLTILSVYLAKMIQIGSETWIF